MSQSSNSEGSEAVVEAEKSGGGVLVQYVVLRRDLIDVWPLGSVVMQGCHASVCAIWMSKDDAHTAEYCSAGNIDSMHKVTLEVKGETGCIGHKLWIERTENKLLVWPQSLTLNPQFHHILKS
uniref:peptidyl-tRNA hydrolase n=1 Tax=Kalanchoe fedtschenkoi TaxID=63787 RepID=A0A7N0RCC4_KALFE